jgi:hypothetical protein
MPPENEVTEQQQTTETPAAPAGAATRDDLIAAAAAVRAAGGDDGAAEAPAPAEAAPAPEETKLDRLFRERQKAHAEREAARNYAEEARARADAERDKIIAEARAEADRIRREEDQRRLDAYKADPIAHLRASGRDPQSIVDDVLRANTPEAKAIARAEAAELAAKRATEQAEGVGKSFESWKAEQARLEQEQRIAQATQSYVTTLASPEAAPYLNARWDQQQIWSESVKVMSDLVASGQRYNVDFDDRDVVAYLERQSRERIAKLSPAAHQVSAAAPVTESGNAPKVQANGPRTLNAAQGSERRSSPKPLYQLPPDQRRQALIDDVAAARRNNPKAEF